MPNNLSENALQTAISHLCRFGDTDIFPHLLELVFLDDFRQQIVDALKSYDVGNFQASHSVEALAPKSRYGFRIANQLLMLDALLLMAATIEIASDLENFKAPDAQYGPFGYRYANNGDGSVLEKNRTYRDWIEFQKIAASDNSIEYVVLTDIADFYQRIYFHRIENVLRSASGEKHASALIERIIRKIRAKQSYGIPVGGTAARFIAEAVLADFDHALDSEEYMFTRFVDDIRIFIKGGDSPYRALAFAAETLLSEGLTLNAQKTRVLTREQYVEFLEDEGLDAFDSTQRAALEVLSDAIYFEEGTVPDPDVLNTLQALNLVEMLDELLLKDVWDFGRIRAVLRALRLTADAEAISYISENFERLLPFIKDVVLFFSKLQEDGKLPPDFSLTETTIRQLTIGAGRSVPVIRAWLLELFIRNITPISARRVNEIERVSELDSRQLIFIHAAIGDIAYFRKNKTRVDQLSPFERYALIIGGSCLPKDEYETWIDALKAGMNQPLDKLFCDWAKTKHGKFAELNVGIGNLMHAVE